MANILQKKLFEEITFFGGLFFYLFLIILFFTLGKADYSLKLFLGLLSVYLLTFIIRIFYFKPRPEKVSYNNFLEKIDASSFPSVHAARTTFLFIFLLVFLPSSLIYIILTLILWLLVLYSRIHLKKHDIIDLIGGILTGILSSLIIFI